jgi:hypothetical protein
MGGGWECGVMGRGAWVRGCVGAWVCGCVGVWVCGCVGACTSTHPWIAAFQHVPNI